MTFDDEHRLVLACAVLPLAQEASAGIESIVARVRSWDRVLAVAAANQVRPQVAAALSQVQPLPTAACVAHTQAQAAARANVGQSLMRSADVVLALDTLRAAGIAAVPFKGPAFAALVGGGPHLREMVDLDLLVRSRDIAAAARALRSLGFDSALPESSLVSGWLESGACELKLGRAGDRGLLELHWRLAPSWHPAPVTVEDVFGRAGTCVALGVSMTWPAPEELFLIHVADAMKSRGEGMRWIGDLLAIIRAHPEMDWDRVQHLAISNEGLNVVCVAAAVVEELGDVASSARDPAIVFALPDPARFLAEKARRVARLRTARDAICARIASDHRVTNPSRRFLWAVQVADRPGRAAAAVARYLARPSVQDLAATPYGAPSGAALRWRALRRRLSSLGR